jgi:hypothetical protein
MKHNTFKLALAAVACLSAFSFAAIPTIRVTVEREPTASGDFVGGTATMNYVHMTKFEITGVANSIYDFTRSAPDSIRIRGNSTAQATKKPYRIKFNDKISLLGKTSAKSWVLLANYYDATFTMNAIAFRLGHKLGLEFTNSSQLVNLYMNNTYKGVYQLTEQVQVNPGRVNIDKEYGWLAEFDYHNAASDEVKFTTSQYSLGTFIKSPEIESNFTVNNPKIAFVRDEINDLCNKMAEGGFPENGYRNLIDLESFARYVLIQQLMDNFDFNSKTQTGALPGSNFAYRGVGNKIKAGPLWDFDLSAGVHATQSFPKHFITYNEAIKPKHVFYQRLWADPVFLAKFKKLWDKHQSDFNAIPDFIDSLSRDLGNSVNNNIYATMISMGWMEMVGDGTLTEQAHKTEVDNLKAWWNDRLNFFGQEINKMNIDISKDIEEPTPIIMPSQITSGNGIAVIKNGIELQTKNNAHVEIYNIRGGLEKSMNFANGVYSVLLNDLPKGMYIVKASFGAGTTPVILRLSVR